MVITDRTTLDTVSPMGSCLPGPIVHFTCIFACRTRLVCAEPMCSGSKKFFTGCPPGQLQYNKVYQYHKVHHTVYKKHTSLASARFRIVHFQSASQNTPCPRRNLICKPTENANCTHEASSCRCLNLLLPDGRLG